MLPPQQHFPILPYKGLTIILGKPSRFDNESGRLLSARAGDFFNNILSPLNRHNCLITTVDHIPPTLPGTKINLLLGQEALDKFRPDKDLRTLRGSTFTHNGQIYLPTFTPQDSYDRRNYENPAQQDAKDDAEAEEAGSKDIVKTRRKNFKFWLYHDVRKTLRLLQFGPRVYPKVNYHIFKSAAEIEKTLYSTTHGNLVIDIETDKQFNLTCFGFCFYKYDELKGTLEIDVYVVPWKRYDKTKAYTDYQFARILVALASAMQNNRVIGHNLAFDLFILALRYKIPYPRNVFCTMIGHHRMYPEVEKSLGHVVSFYTDLPFHKDEGIFDPRNPEQEFQLWNYNGKDIATTLFVFLGMLPELIKHKALESALQGSGSLRTYLTLQYEGAKLDTTKTCEKIDAFTRRYNALEKLLSILTKRKLNPRSHDQVGDYLFKTLKLPEPETKKTSEDNLHKLYIISGAPSIRVILEMRGIGTLKSKLVGSLLWRNQRLTCAYKVTGTDMHRVSSSKLLKFKPFKGWGTNMANFHKSIRGVVVPDDGMIMGQTDQSGADAKIVSYLCVPDKLRELFNCGIKPHTYVAMQIVPTYWAIKLGVPDIDEYIYAPVHKLKELKYWKDLATVIAESENHPEPQHQYYKIGKTMVHSLNFGATWPMFQIIALKRSDGVLRLTNEQCKYYCNAYSNQIFPELPTWWQEVQATCKANNRTLRNLFGYPRQFGGFWGDELFKQLYAYIPQSTVAIISHLCGQEIQTRVDDKDPLFDGFSLLQNGYDSWLWQCPKENWKPVAYEVKKHMERKLKNFRGEEFVMGTGTSIGYNWSPKSDKEPNGLEELKGEWWL